MARTQKTNEAASFPQAPVKQTQLELVVVGLAEAENLNQEVEESLKKMKAQILKKADWGLRAFSRPIKRERQGIYSFFLISVPVVSLPDLEKDLRLNGKILRYSLIHSGKTKDQKRG